MPDVRELLSSPDFFALSVDLKRHTIRFVRMSRDDYRNGSFLDLRAHSCRGARWDADIDELAASAAADVSCTDASPRYIFHTAFCCSTLLARQCELIPGCFVLKEPYLLFQLAALQPIGQLANEPQIPCDEWRKLADICVRLLARRYDPADLLIVKTGDACISLATTLLARDENARAVFLTLDLRDFLLLALKRPHWIGNRIAIARKDSIGFPLLAPINPHLLDFAKMAAYIWLVNSLLWQSVNAGLPGGRVGTMNGREVAESPFAAVKSVMTRFDAGIPGDDLDSLFSANCKRHAKQVSRPYDAATRLAELWQLQQRFGAEVESAVQWARMQAAVAGVNGFFRSLIV